MIVVRCEAHGHENVFDQPYQYHAGFADQGFLYNDAGDLTLVWSSFDPAYVALVGRAHPWTLDESSRARVESALMSAPHGGRWRFTNTPRCLTCGEPIGKALADGAIQYVVYPGSLVLDHATSHQDSPPSCCRLTATQPRLPADNTPPSPALLSSYEASPHTAAEAEQR